jgi:hypothetical protein
MAWYEPPKELARRLFFNYSRSLWLMAKAHSSSYASTCEYSDWVPITQVEAECPELTAHRCQYLSTSTMQLTRLIWNSPLVSRSEESLSTVSWSMLLMRMYVEADSSPLVLIPDGRREHRHRSSVDQALSCCGSRNRG